MQESIVAIIVACAFVAVAKRYLPKAVQAAMRRFAASVLRKLGLTEWARKLEARQPAAAASCADGCGSCGGCGTPQKQFTITPEALKRTMPR